MQPADKNQFQGIYSLPEAARLLRVSTQRVRSWANGYTYKRKDARGEKLPVLQTDRTYPRVLNFRELFELMAVREFRKLDVPLEKIRETAGVLADRLNTEYPFANQQLFISGRELVQEHAAGLISPTTGQLVMEQIKPLALELEFAHGTVARWHPRAGEKAVLVDPTHKSGDPILEALGIPTRTLFRTYQVEQDLQRVAEYYDVKEADLLKVIRFEQSLRETG